MLLGLQGGELTLVIFKVITSCICDFDKGLEI